MKYRLSLPDFDFAYRMVGETKMIFDPVRRHYVNLTPEEWVRQNFLQFLIQDRNVPAALIAVEVGFKYERMTRRADIVVHGRSGEKLLVAECKAPDVRLTQRPFDQIARYNTVLDARYLVVTNGRQHYCCEVNRSEGTLRFVTTIPTFEELSTP